MAREDPQLKLRLTDTMKERVTRAARDSNRSVNAEIVSRLEDSFGPPQAVLIRALMEMGGALLDETLSVTLPPDVIDKLRDIGESRGLSIESTIAILVTKAVYHISSGTDVGREIESIIEYNSRD